jgi:hypothetical protein
MVPPTPEGARRHRSTPGSLGPPAAYGGAQEPFAHEPLLHVFKPGVNTAYAAAQLLPTHEPLLHWQLVVHGEPEAWAP